MSVDLVVKNGDNCYWIEKPVFFFFIITVCYFGNMVIACLHTEYSDPLSIFPECASRVLYIDVYIPENLQTGSISQLLVSTYAAFSKAVV